MSDSSSASGSRSHGGGGGVQGSPVAYRIGPLAYHPAVQCECKGKPKACRWISWDDENPGRRYHRCQRSTVPALDCGFFRWFDEEEVSDWYKELLRDLRDAVWGLKKDGAKQEAKLEAVEKKLIAKQMEVEEEKNKLEAVEQKLIAKQMEVEEEKNKLEAKQLELYLNNQKLIAMRQQLTTMQRELIGKQQEL